MEIKTFRARSLQDALRLVREELGPDASVLHTREVSRGPIGRLLRRKEFEIAASAVVHVPSRLPERLLQVDETNKGVLSPTSVANSTTQAPQGVPDSTSVIQEQNRSLSKENHATPAAWDYRTKFRDDFRNQVQGQLEQLTTLVEGLCNKPGETPRQELPESLFQVFTNLIESDIDEEVARDFIDRVRQDAVPQDLRDPLLIMSRVASYLENEIQVAGPIQLTPGKRRIVALIGPTGVGKTTTIAKLAANFRLREKKRVGLITVDTYRIAAVEQLRTYADIIDLPMEVVTTPREMREAVARLHDLDLVLLDTAGRSPRDEVKIQELKSMLGETSADEVHLVLSSTAGSANLLSTAERFKDVGATSILLTKLDEASSLGNLFRLVRDSNLPLSYLTDGQNVPDDIQVAESRKLAKMMLELNV